MHPVHAVVPGLGIKRRLMNESITTAQSLGRALAATRPDVVVTTVPALSSLPLGWLVAHARRIPLVVDLRDAWPHLMNEIDTWNEDGTVRRPRAPRSRRRLASAASHMITAMHRDAAATIVTAGSLGDDLVKRGHDHVVLARNVVRSAVATSPLDVSRQGLNVLYLGSIGRAQKLATLVHAANLAREKGLDVRLRIVGSGVQKTPLQGLVERTDAPVELLPRVSRAEVAEHYEWADTVVVALRDWDGLKLTVPSKLYEALQTGRHVTGSVAGEAAEIIRGSGAGDVVPPEDPEALASLWVSLAADRSRLDVGHAGAAWLQENAQPEHQVSAVVHALEVAAMTQSSPIHRARALAQDVALAVVTTSRHVNDDAATFFVQIARRLAVVQKVPRRFGPPSLRILANHLADQPAAMAEAAKAWTPGRNRILDRLAASSLLARGHREAVPESLVTTADRARWRLEAGDVSGALNLLPPGSAIAERTESQLKVLQPGFALDVPGRPRPGWRPAADRVLHVLTNSLPDTRSGYTQRSHSIMLAEQQLGWKVAGATRIAYPVTVGVVGRPHTVEVDGIRLHRLMSDRLPGRQDDRLAEQARLLDQLVDHSRPSILHTTTDYTNALPVEAVARGRNIPWVYEMRGQLELTWLSKRPASLAEEAARSERLRLSRDRETACAQAADAVVVLSEVQRDDLVRRGVPQDKITVAPNAVDGRLLERRRTTPAESRAERGLPGSGLWFGAVSSLVDYEGFDTLLHAVALLRQDGLDAHCVLAGDGTSRPHLMALADELGIADLCQFPGRVGREEALGWVECLDAVVVPRRDTPVCRMVTPLKPVEAMALGRPVVGSNLPALAELIKPIGGLLSAPDDARALAESLGTLVDNPSVVEAQVAAGREFAADRTWAAVGQRYDSLYASLGGRR